MLRGPGPFVHPRASPGRRARNPRDPPNAPAAATATATAAAAAAATMFLPAGSLTRGDRPIKVDPKRSNHLGARRGRASLLGSLDGLRRGGDSSRGHFRKERAPRASRASRPLPPLSLPGERPRCGRWCANPSTSLKTTRDDYTCAVFNAPPCARARARSPRSFRLLARSQELTTLPLPLFLPRLYYTSTSIITL